MSEISLHHISLIVADSRRSLDFYCNILGMASAERPDLGFPGAWLQLGEQQIHLLELDNPDPVTGRPEHGGRDRHSAFSVADLAVFEQRLQAAAIPFSPSRSGRRALFCRDPDGNAIELIEESPSAVTQTERQGFLMDDIVNAFSYSDFSPNGESCAYICLEEGKIVYREGGFGGFVDDEEDEIDVDACIALPTKNDLDLGKQLVFQFIAEQLPDELDSLDEIFSRKGAYRRYKDFLERHNLLDHWYDYENTAQENALRAWCENNDIPLKD